MAVDQEHGKLSTDSKKDDKRGDVVSELHVRLYENGDVTVQMIGDFDNLYQQYMKR